MPIATPPTLIADTSLSLPSFWPQVVPSSSAFLMKHFFSATGWPSMPPSCSLATLTARSAPSVAAAPISCCPPSWLSQPM